MATSLASGTRILYRLIERHGGDPQAVFRAAGLDPTRLNDPRARFPFERTLTAWREAARLIRDPRFGLQAGAVWRATDFHALGYAFLASGTLRTAIERAVRYHAVVGTGVGFEQRLDATHLRLSYRSTRSDWADIPALEDARWAVVMRMCREAYGPGCDPRAVAFTHAAPACTGDYFALFRCPIRFDAPVAEMAFDRALAEQPLPARNRELARANDAILRTYIDQLEAQDLIARVRAAILDRLPSGAPSAEAIAKALLMSHRTLQRRLTELDTGYAEILDALRRELAAQYLADPDRSLSEIGYLLGFAELSGFSRAFRRWTGQAPSQAREAATA